MKGAPGECYSYQNVAFSLVVNVVYGASGQFFNEAVTRRIFKPLGMDDASYGLEVIEASQSWARPHVRAGGGWRSLTPQPTYYRDAPAPGVNASASDIARKRDVLGQRGVGRVDIEVLCIVKKKKHNTY